MSKTIKFAAATVFGAIVSVAPASVTLAGPMGVGQPAVAPIELPLENVHWRRCHHGWRCHHHHHWSHIRTWETCGGWGWPFWSSAAPVSYTVTGLHW